MSLEIQNIEQALDVKKEETCEIISSLDVVELEQRYEYDTNITICHYEWHK